MLSTLATARRNERTMHLDEMAVEEFLAVMNEEDQPVPHVIQEQLWVIADVEACHRILRKRRAFDLYRRRDERALIRAIGSGMKFRIEWLKK